jgi:hypothetical protein
MTIGVLAGKMLANDLVGDRQELSTGTCRVLDFRRLADVPRPLIRAGGLITRMARLATLKSTRINILAPAKERTEQGDFGNDRRSMMNGSGVGGHANHR